MWYQHKKPSLIFCLVLTPVLLWSHEKGEVEENNKGLWYLLSFLPLPKSSHNPIDWKECTPMFIAALFIIARTWKQPRCPSADEWIRKLWYIYTMEYYAAIKKNSLESILMRWMKLEPIIQSEVSQKDKDHYSILTHIYGIKKDVNDNPICRTEKKKRHRLIAQSFRLCGRRRGWDVSREQHRNMYSI